MEYTGLWILIKNGLDITGMYNNYFDLPCYFDGQNYFDCGIYTDDCGDDVIYKQSLSSARDIIRKSQSYGDPVLVVDITRIVCVLYYGFSGLDKLYLVDNNKKIFDVCEDLLHGRAP